jgi:hypothetical protein
MDPENVERFDAWLASRAFTEAIARIVELDAEIVRLNAAQDEALSRADRAEYRANMADPNWRPGDV